MKRTYNDADAKVALSKWLKDARDDLTTYNIKEPWFAFFRNEELTTQRKVACGNVLGKLNNFSIDNTLPNSQVIYKINQLSGILQDGVRKNNLLTTTYGRKDGILKDGPGEYNDLLNDYGAELADLSKRFQK